MGLLAQDLNREEEQTVSHKAQGRQRLRGWGGRRRRCWAQAWAPARLCFASFPRTRGGAGVGAAEGDCSVYHVTVCLTLTSNFVVLRHVWPEPRFYFLSAA